MIEVLKIVVHIGAICYLIAIPTILIYFLAKLKNGIDEIDKSLGLIRYKKGSRDELRDINTTLDKWLKAQNRKNIISEVHIKELAHCFEKIKSGEIKPDTKGK